MSWSKAVLAGVAAGIATNIVDFVNHGVLLSETYVSMPEVFAQEQANPAYFVAISICTGIAASILFAKTRDSWAAGWTGGATFGFWLGLVAFFGQFIHSLVIEGFPYYLGWCWGGTTLIAAIVGGAVLGAINKG